MWEEETDDNTRAVNSSRPKDVAQLESLAVRRSVLLALVFNHLCYFHPKMVTLEDSPQGLSLRLGIALDLLAQIKELLTQPPLAGLQSATEFAATHVNENWARVFQSGRESSCPGSNQGAGAGSVVVLQVAVGE